MRRNWVICEVGGNGPRGVSLLEILLVVILFGFLVISFTAIYLAANRYLIQDTAAGLAQGDAAFAVDHIKRKLIGANRLVQLADAEIVFRFEPNFPGTPADFSNDQWAGYRLNGNALEFVPDVNPSTDTNGDGSVDAGDDPIEANLNGAAAESPPVARGVLAPGGSVPALFARPSDTLLKVDLTVQKSTGGNSRQTRLKSAVSLRGVLS